MYTPPRSIAQRVIQAKRQNNLFAWRNLAEWLGAESIRATCAGRESLARHLRNLSNHAYARYFDMMPAVEAA